MGMQQTRFVHTCQRLKHFNLFVTCYWPVLQYNSDLLLERSLRIQRICLLCVTLGHHCVSILQQHSGMMMMTDQPSS